jgi:hypothetical protein
MFCRPEDVFNDEEIEESAEGEDQTPSKVHQCHCARSNCHVSTFNCFVFGYKKCEYVSEWFMLAAIIIVRGTKLGVFGCALSFMFKSIIKGT